MNLRKLAWLAPLLVAATAVQAEAVSAFAPMVHADATRSTGHQGQPAKASKTSNTSITSNEVTHARTLTAPETVQASVSADEPNAPRDIKGLAALVGGLALVGWFQRRRPNA